MRRTIFVVAVLMVCGMVWANSAPVVSNVVAAQRADNSKLIDITYDLTDADDNPCTVWAVISDDGGTTWNVPILTVSGQVGPNQTPGLQKHIIWDAGRDIPGIVKTFKARVYADDGQVSQDMVSVPAGAFPYQGGQPVFVNAFYMAKYELTNTQYCEYLNNDQLNSDSHWVSNMAINRSGQTGNYYYSVIQGRENHPITYVNKYDADAYCAWLSNKTGLMYRLPTEQEWEKAAGWDAANNKMWTYAFNSTTFDNTWCNAYNWYGGTLPIGSFNGTNGKNDARSPYGCYDMSGNIWEWTGSKIDSTRYMFRGGFWGSDASDCRVASRTYDSPAARNYHLGFRLVLVFE